MSMLTPYPAVPADGSDTFSAHDAHGCYREGMYDGLDCLCHEVDHHVYEGDIAGCEVCSPDDEPTSSGDWSEWFAQPGRVFWSGNVTVFDQVQLTRDCRVWRFRRYGSDAVLEMPMSDWADLQFSGEAPF